ncbi:ribonuclease H-like domain-containing protein [Tanacetum coccineum]
MVSSVTCWCCVLILSSHHVRVGGDTHVVLMHYRLVHGRDKGSVVEYYANEFRQEVLVLLLEMLIGQVAPLPDGLLQGVANIVAETAWTRNLLHELHSPLSSATLVYCDKVSVIYLSANPVQHQQTKHIKIDIISSVILLPLVRFEFYMYPLVISTPKSSPKGCLRLCSKSFAPVYTNVSYDLISLSNEFYNDDKL